MFLQKPPMKKIIFFSLYFFCFILSAQVPPGQATITPTPYTPNTKLEAGYIVVTGGLGIPTGDYASTDIKNNNAAGLAKNGGSFGLTAFFRLTKNFGLTLMYRSQSNTVDPDPIKKDAVNSYPNMSWDVQVDPWKINYLLFGVGDYIKIDNNDALHLGIHAMIGPAFATSPKETITAYQNGSYITGVQDAVTSGAVVAYLMGFTFKCDIGRRLCIVFSADYTNTKPTFSNITVTTGNQVAHAPDFTQQISLFTLSAGIGLRLH